jgi:hypothetical protein
VKSLRLQDLFPDQAPLVFAEWVTELLVVATGPRLIYKHFGFESLHASYRTIDVAAGRVQSIRNWVGREWAQETGRYWPDEDWYKTHPQALVWPERAAQAERGKPEDDVNNWRIVEHLPRRRLGYQAAQIAALRRPCGQRPSD